VVASVGAGRLAPGLRVRHLPDGMGQAAGTVGMRTNGFLRAGSDAAGEEFGARARCRV